MAVNNLQFRTEFSDKLDKAVVQGAVTGFMKDNDMGAKFIRADTVMVPELTMTGLSDYDRDNGFTRSPVTVTHTPHKLEMDRAKSFQIDSVDASDTGIPNIAGTVAAEVVRTQSVPEVDAYVLSKLATHATTSDQLVRGTVDSEIYKMFNEAMVNIYDALSFEQNLVCFVDPTVWAALMNTTSISRQITVSDFKKGEVNLKVKSLNDVAILPVTSKRMHTAFTFGADGFTPAGDAKKIGMLMLPKAACQLINKHEITRIFEPDRNPDADAWKIDYRIHYDALIGNTYKGGIFAYTY